MYKFKDVAQRSTALVTATSFFAMLSVAAFPNLAFADALNPLTERSLLLSSSAPGYQDRDGSGNSETIYSPPGSGPNGKKTGETFSFKVSTDSSSSDPAIKAFTLQYCTTAAGLCTAPGNNTGDANTADRGSDSYADKTSDLDVVYPSAVAGTDFTIKINGGADQASSGSWTLAATNVENGAGVETGKNNFITLKSASGITPAAGDQVEIKFIASATQFITNPGDDAFFVKINTYDTDAALGQLPDTSANIIDGGVTVANVMTDSIWITTKVLETMSFSVGTTNPDTVDHGTGNGNLHGGCDKIAVNDIIQLGNAAAEYSLEPGTAYDANSYWRLSSNSSGGATVYYSGYTLSNTVGDQIAAVNTGNGNEAISHPGTEQFGLAIDSSADTLSVSFLEAVAADPEVDNPTLLPLVAGTTYDEGAGLINEADYLDNTAKFAFNTASLTIPEPIAAETSDVLHCATGKMRYIANIAPDTPAGVYTTKINYLAAPQY